MSTPVELFSDEFRRDPYPVYAELRRRAPVSAIVPPRIWAAFSHDHVSRVLRDHGTFSSVGAAATGPERDDPFGDAMVTMDPPAHTRLRVLCHRAFTRGVEHLTPRIRSVAAELAGGLRDGGDFIADYAAPLSSAVLAELLGDPALAPRLRTFAQELVRSAIPIPALAALARPALDELERALRAVIDARRRCPADDLVGALVQAHRPDEALSDREVLSFLGLLVVAGLDTGAQLLTHTAVCWTRHPAVFARAQEDPALVSALLDEVLRLEPPVHAVDRTTRVDVELGGVTVPAGATVLAFVASANRDEGRFAEPDRFLLDRDRRALISFGHGAHYCIGAPLARLVARISLEALFARFAGVALAGPLAWEVSPSTRSPSALPLAYLPRRGAGSDA